MKRMRPLLGTFVEIGAEGPASQLEPALANAFAAIESIQRSLSFQDPDSELSRLNARPSQWVPMSRASLVLLRLARALTHRSEGYFNCTVAGALARSGHLPDHLPSAATISVGEASDIELAPGAARLRRPVRITLDGIAKGYAVDCAIKVLRAHQLEAGWVNAGGDLRVFGTKQQPIHQRGLDGQLAPLGALRDAAIATSCVKPAQDPRFPAWIVGRAGDGQPTPGVHTVMARQAWRADALAKIACLAPACERQALLSRLGGHYLEAQRVAA